MDYPPRVRALLDRVKATQGDGVVVQAKGERYEGTLMPHHGFSVPELLEVCNIRARVIYSIYSENLKPENWQRLAREAAKELESGAAGVVIPHGTDTLHFTTAALSFMLRDLTAPVVVVGAQRS